MDEHNPHYKGWRVVAAGAVGVFFAAAPYQVFAVFFKPLAEEFSWSRESVSTAFGVMTFLAALSAPAVGRLLDRHGARRVILPCLALSASAVTSLAALTPALGHLYLVFGTIGLATIGASPVAHSRAIFSWFDAHRGRALGLMLAGAAAGGVILPPTVDALVRTFGWRVAWLSLGAAGLGIGLPIVFRFLHERTSAAGSGVTGAAGATVREALSSRAFWTVIAVVFGSTLAIHGATVHMAALLTDRGLSAGWAAAAISAMGAASLAGRLVTGWLLDRYTAARVSVVLLLMASFGTFLLAGAHSLAAGVLAAILIGFGSGGETDVVPYLLSRYFGLRSLSTLYGLNWTAWGLAGVVGPILMGRAFDATGTYETVLVQLAALTLVTAGLMLSLPGTTRQVAGPAASPARG